MDVSTTSTYSYGLAITSSSSLTHSQQEKFTITCPARENTYLTVWQWETTISHPEDGADGPTTDVLFNAHFCLYGTSEVDEPMCPLGACSADDPTCQTCIAGWQQRRL